MPLALRLLDIQCPITKYGYAYNIYREYLITYQSQAYQNADTESQL